MATDKLARGKGKALAPLEDWEQRLADKARDDRAKETLGLPRITHRGGVLKVGDKKVDGNEIVVATIEYAHAKTYYEGEFNEGDHSTPVCYAYSHDGKGMAPHPQSPKPQNPTCAGCKWNEFGTASKGRGKACKDERKLLVVIGSDVGRAQSDVSKVEKRAISVPPASLKNFGNYLNSLKDVTRTGSIYAVLTKIKPEPSERGAHVLTFSFEGEVPRAAMPGIVALQNGAYDLLATAYPVIADEVPVKNSRKGGSNKKLD